MNDIQRISIVRIFSDLIKADRIITPEEISFFKDVQIKYKIDSERINKSMSISFSSALNNLCSLNNKEKEELLNDFKLMSLSDGTCCREEALLLIAIIYCLNGYGARTVSTPVSGINLENAQVLYIEEKYHKDLNSQIDRNYRAIYNELKSVNFEFVYAPIVAKRYNETDQLLLASVINYLAPSLSKMESDNVRNVLNSITTEYLKCNILSAKLGIKLGDFKSSLIIKTGNSVVGGVLYADFLLLEIKNDILSDVQKFIDNFIHLLSSNQIVIDNVDPTGNNFIYAGFYKTLFDIVTYRKGTKCSIIVDPRKGDILLQNLSEVNLKLGKREAALYALFLLNSHGRGTILSNSSTLSYKERKEINELKSEYIKQYSIIYNRFGGDLESVPDILVSSNSAPMRTKIKNAILKQDRLIDHNLYIPLKDDSDFIKINLELNLIYVKERTGKIVLMSESKEWKDLMKKV